jgi:adenosylhomocysteine nucleosidase
MNTIIGLVFATKIESAPFIKGLGLQKIGKKPFDIYNKDNIFLIKSGIGKANAAMATSYLISKYNVNSVLNIGAAGASTAEKKIGDIFHINKTVEFDRPKLLNNGIRISKPEILKGFSTASLATQDKPVVSPEDRKNISKHADLVDMEGAAVVQACRLWDVKCFLFKIITDTPEHKEIEIIKNVYMTAGKMFEFFKANILKNFN